MTADELLARLQAVLQTRVHTGKITLNLKDGQIESFEQYTYARIKRKVLDEAKNLGA